MVTRAGINMTTKKVKLSEKERRERQAALKVQRNKDSQPVKGVFRFHEVPGGGVSFCYKIYDGDEVQRYDLIDGQVYTIPFGVARHLNKSGKYPVHEHTMGENGKPSMKIGRMVSRYAFQSLEFMDLDEDLRPDLVTVEFADKK
jgi:hypothetical protein